MPAIDLREGACVQLVGGRIEHERVRIADPREAARRWRAAGFTALHVVDLDAALALGTNRDAIESLLALWKLEVQVGGGVRDEEAAARLLWKGAARVVVGTRAIEDPAWLEALAVRFPGRVVVAADVRGREVVTHGWHQGSGLDLFRLLDRLAPLPLAAVLITAVHREGLEQGPDLSLLAEAARRTRLPIQAAGGIASLDDLRALAAAGLSAAIVGMAIYRGGLDPAAVTMEFETCRS